MGSIETSEKFGSVSKRLILYIVVSSSVITLILTFFQLNIEYQSDLSGIHNRFEQVQKIYLKSVSEVMWASDFDKLKIILEGLSNFADITYIEAREDGNVVVAIGESKALDTITQLIPITHDYRGETIQIGTLRVEADLGAAYKRILNKVIVILGSNAIKTAIVVLLMILIFRNLVTKPLAQITDYIRSIKIEGPFAPLSLSRDKLSTDSRDEIDIVVDSINESSLQVVKFIEEIREQGNVLKLSERRFKQLFDNSEVSIWNEDFSEVLKTLDNLQDSGLEDLRLYLDDNEQVAWDMAAMIKVTGVNQATLKLFGANSEKDFIYQVDKTFSSDAMDIFKDQLCAIWDQQPIFRSEARYKTFDGSDIACLISLPIPKSRDSARNVPVSIIDITERKQLELAMQQSQDKYLDLFEHAPDMYINVNPKSTNVIQCNQTLINILGFRKEEIIGQTIFNLYTEESAKYVKNNIIPMFMDKGIVSNEQLQIKKKNGDIIDVSLNMTASRDEQGNILNSRAIWRDITSLIDTQKELKDKSEKLEIAIAGTNDGLWLWDLENNHEWHAPQWKILLGYDDNDEIPENYFSWESRIHPDDKEKVLNILKQHLEHNVAYDCEQRLRTKSNEYKWFRDRGTAIRDESGKPIRMGGSIQDISKLKKAEERHDNLNKELEILSMQDGLTGIANRRMFDQRLKHEWARSLRKKQPLSLILVDIDLFKTYNDIYGHVAGDECLKNITQTLSNVIKRPSDLVARYGGEEFVLLLPETDAIHANYLAEECSKKILEQQIPHKKLNVNSYVTISLGVCTTIPDSDKQVLSLVESADKALYQAKNNGRNQVISIEFSNH